MCINFLDSFRLTQERARTSVKGGGAAYAIFCVHPLRRRCAPPPKNPYSKIILNGFSSY